MGPFTKLSFEVCYLLFIVLYLKKLFTSQVLFHKEALFGYPTVSHQKRSTYADGLTASVTMDMYAEFPILLHRASYLTSITLAQVTPAKGNTQRLSKLVLCLKRSATQLLHKLRFEVTVKAIVTPAKE